MARETANASIDFRGVPHLLARPSKQDPDGVVVWSEIQPILEEIAAVNDEIATKLSLAQLEIEQNKKLASVIKRFNLTEGDIPAGSDTATTREVSTGVGPDGDVYTYTTYRISTGFKDARGHTTMDFEDFAMSAILQPYSNQGFRYEFQKRSPDVALIEFESIIGAFPDGQVRIALALIPDPVEEIVAAVGAELNPTNPDLASFKTNFFNWTNFDGRFGAGSWNRVYRGMSLNSDGLGVVHFANGNTLTNDQVDAYFNAQDLGSVDIASGVNP